MEPWAFLKNILPTRIIITMVKQSVHEVSTAWHVAEVVQDISATANSTTSYGGLSKEQEYQL